jgi:hypothetical protein
MARATFDGPVLVGDNRFGPLRNVGTAELVQGITLNFGNVTPATAGYGGGSGIFAGSNNILNTPAQVYTPGSNPPTAQTITADVVNASSLYRGAVFYVPVGADLHDLLIDVQAVPTFGSGSFGNLQFFCSNKFDGAAGSYFQTGATGGIGRTALSTFTAAQMAAQQSTSADILQGSGQPNVSQVVVTCVINGTTMNSLNGGIINITLRYGVPDNNIGNATTYPYGNLD